MDWKDDPFFVRNLTYGIEDSLISTTGVVVGVSLSGLARKDVIITGIILVLVEALSMSFGAFVSEDAYMQTADIQRTPAQVSKYAGVMFVSYLAAGIVPLLPFLLDAQTPWKYSIGLTLASLFTLVILIQKNYKKASLLTSIGGVILGISVAAGTAMK